MSQHEQQLPATPATAIRIKKRRTQQTLEGIPPDDASERKRVLNVLAQRRYRQRKRERVAQLEQILESVQPSTWDQEQSRNPYNNPQDVHLPVERSSSTSSSGGLPSMSSLTSGWPTGSWTSPLLESELETDALYGIESLDWKAPCLVDDAAFANTQLVSDAFVSTASADVPATEQLNYSRDQSFSPRRLTYFGVSGAQSLLERRNVNTTFADDHLLDTPEIDMLRAFLSIASRLRCTDRVWSLSSTSVFHDPPPDLRLEDVPHHLLPTRTQQTVLHHPGIDTLPWPGVRNRLLAVWSLPEEHWSRHPSDGESCNMLKLFQGLESGGVKIWGPDPTAIDALEIQQSFFNVWWWALDHTAIAASNKRRLARGSRRLTIAEA